MASLNKAIIIGRIGKDPEIRHTQSGQAVARLTEDASVKAEADRRAADLAHREGIHRAMLDALKSHGIPDKYAVDVVCLLRSNAIPFVTVEY